MKRVVILLLLVLLPWKINAEDGVYFSPHGGCTAAIVNELAGAKKSVLVQAYSFTSEPIAKALVEAHKRGVLVRVILDKSNKPKPYIMASVVARAGVPTFIDSPRGIAHSKVMIIDGETVITGSFNFTMAAENSNVENLLVIHDAELAEHYIENWNARFKLSHPYVIP